MKQEQSIYYLLSYLLQYEKMKNKKTLDSHSQLAPDDPF